jgi:hypothetical protein
LGLYGYFQVSKPFLDQMERWLQMRQMKQSRRPGAQGFFMDLQHLWTHGVGNVQYVVPQGQVRGAQGFFKAIQTMIHQI